MGRHGDGRGNRSARHSRRGGEARQGRDGRRRRRGSGRGVTVPKIDGWLPYEKVHGKRHSVTGTVYVWPSLASAELSHVREITVYVPPSVATARDSDPVRRYPVIY